MDTKQLDDVITKIKALKERHKPTAGNSGQVCSDCLGRDMNIDPYPCNVVLSCDIVLRLYDLGRFTASPLCAMTVKDIGKEIMFAIGYGFNYDTV
jgi:hypothetical protein